MVCGLPGLETRSLSLDPVWWTCRLNPDLAERLTKMWQSVSKYGEQLTSRRRSLTCVKCSSLPPYSIILNCLTYNTFSSFAGLIGGVRLLFLLRLWPFLPVSDFSGNVPLFVSGCLTNDKSRLHKTPLLQYRGGVQTVFISDLQTLQVINLLWMLNFNTINNHIYVYNWK